MIDWLTDIIVDKIFGFNINKDHSRTILTGGWIILIAFIILLIGSEAIIASVVISLVGAAFLAGGLYSLIKEEKARKSSSGAKTV